MRLARWTRMAFAGWVLVPSACTRDNPAFGDSAELLNALELLGGILVLEDRGAEAIAPLSRALALCERGKAGPDCRASLDELLANARSSAIE